MSRLLRILALLIFSVGFLLPTTVLILLRWLPPPTTAFMLASETRPVSYRWVPAGEIPEHLRKAVVAAEDQKFWTHQGFDLEAIEEAYVENKKRKRKRGASTITQQTVKNLFLWQGGGYLRKSLEAALTFGLEFWWSKPRILEVYLNVAEFGPGIYGAEAAARKFFGKPAAELTPEEAARLAAVLPSPRRWRAAGPGPYVLARSEWILSQIGYRPRVPEPPAEAAEEALPQAEEFLPGALPPTEEPPPDALPEESAPE